MSLLFSPGRIGSIDISNRIVHSATYEAMAGENGEITDRLIKRYANLAKGETGLIIPGYMYVQRSGKALTKQTGIDSDALVPGLTRLADAVHEHGGKIVFQIAHAGRQTTKTVTGRAPVGPSAFDRDPVNFVKPKEMTEKEIRETIAAFGAAAARAAEAGADGAQIHAAHGYLGNQFLSPFFNRRQDSWGGSAENRFRFIGEIVSEIRKSTPEGFPILIKMNVDDHTPSPGIIPESATYYAEKLVECGVDAVEISSGGALYSFMNTCRGDVPIQELCEAMPFWKRPMARIMLNRMVGKFDFEEAYHLGAAKLIKPVLGAVPLILVGGMRSASLMEQTLNDGHADFISMSRPFIREPFLVKKLKEGKADKAQCVSCNKCFAAIAKREPLKCHHKASA